MICLWDNDFLLCLASLDLLSEALVVLGIVKESIWVLPSAKYKIRSLSGQYPNDGIERALQFIETVQKVQHIADKDLDLLYPKIDEIDAGEKLLLAVAMGSQNAQIATGDKRFLRRLATANGYEPYRLRLQRSIVCLEYAVKLIVEKYGAEYVKPKVVPNRNCNTSIKTAFGSGMLATLDNIQFSLKSKIAELDQETAGMLII